MPTVIYVEEGGKKHVVEVSAGLTVMQGAVKNLVPGIDADCGGSCACATCHVYVGEEFAERMPRRSDMEVTMLEFANSVTSESRLSCQIRVTPELDGITVHLPASQK